MAGLKDRLVCPSCSKEIMNRDRRRIYECPYCAWRIPLVKWMEADDISEIAKIGRGDALLRKGVLFQEQGKNDEAMKCYDEAVALDCNDRALWMNRGSIFAQSGDVAGAVAAFDRAISLGDDVEAWVGKGMVLAMAGRFAEAGESCDEAASLDSSHEKVRLLKLYIDTNSSAAQGVPDAAMSGLDRSSEDDVKRRARTLQLLEEGRAFTQAFQGESGNRCFDELIALGVETAEVWTLKGTCLWMLGQARLEEALGCYDRAIAIDAGYARAWEFRGVALNGLGRKKEAKQCSKKAAKLERARR